MEAYRRVINLFNFGLAILLTISVLFSTSIYLPDQFAFIGRMHALVLHLPIGMFFICLLFIPFGRYIDSSSSREFQQLIIELTATTALLSAQIGLLLAQEGGYTAENLYDHKISALIFAFGMYIYSAYNKYISSNRQWMAFGVLSIALIFAGHNGGVITHGEDFLFPNNKVNLAQLDPVTASVYDWAIHPILTDKCTGCHNLKKSKGGLILIDSIHVSNGGDNGSVIVNGNSSESTLIKVIALPIEDDDHMPPSGKAQLSDREIKLIKLWIDNGSSYSTKLSDYPSDSTYAKVLTKLVVEHQSKNKYQFEAANPKIIENIVSPYLSIRSLSLESPALEAAFHVASSYDNDQLKELVKLKDQIVSISLINMPLTDNDVGILAAFEQVEKLNLNGTSITGEGIKKLIGLHKLESLSLMGTSIRLQDEGFFDQWAALKQLYLSNTGIAYTDIVKMRKEYPHLSIYAPKPSEELSALSPPQIINDQVIFGIGEKLELTQRISNAEIKFTLDGSEPDSTNGEIYLHPISITKGCDLKTIVYKDGWLPSAVATYAVFSKGVSPTNITLSTAPSAKYPGQGATTVIDEKKAPVTNLQDPRWMGFLEENYTSLFEFEKPTSLKQISLAYGLHVPAYVFPPTHIIVLAGNSAQELRQISKLSVSKIKQDQIDDIRNAVVHIELDGQAYSHYKIIAQTLPKIPNWHPGKGTKGWLFIDEIFFYE